MKWIQVWFIILEMGKLFVTDPAWDWKNSLVNLVVSDDFSWFLMICVSVCVQNNHMTLLRMGIGIYCEHMCCGFVQRPVFGLLETQNIILFLRWERESLANPQMVSNTSQFDRIFINHWLRPEERGFLGKSFDSRKMSKQKGIFNDKTNQIQVSIGVMAASCRFVLKMMTPRKGEKCPRQAHLWV